MNGRSYVYHVLVDGVVRYVGKGTGNRVTQHLSIARRLNRVRAQGHKVKATYFHNKLAKSMAKASVIATAIMAGGLSERDAYALERETIASYPEGQLWNLWVGGTGSFAASPDLRKILSLAAKKRYQDPEQLRALRERLAITAASMERNSKIAAKQKARFSLGDAGTKRFHDASHTPEIYRKRGDTLKQTYQERPEIITRTAAQSSAWWSDPANNSSQRQKLTAAWSRPETRQKHRAYIDSPEGRAKLKAASDARWAKVRAARVGDCSDKVAHA